MSTQTLPVTKASRQHERLFFAGVALLLAAVVFTGFGHSYFRAGMLRAPLPNLLVHIHAAVFTSWMILFLIQTGLVSARRVAWHRALGVAAYCLAPIMVPLGAITGLDELRRERIFLASGQPTVPAESAIFFAESILGIALFGIVVFASWRARRRPDAHKRLVLYATIGLSSGALIRFPWTSIGSSIGMSASGPVLGPDIALGLLLMLVVAYDLYSLRRLHPASLWAAPLTFAVFALTTPVGQSAWWNAFATFLARTAANHV